MVKTVKVGTLDFNWVWTLSSAIINFYELKRARSASLVPQTETKRSYRHLNCFLPLALSVMLLQIRHLGASESLIILAVFQCATPYGFNESSQLFPILLPLSVIFIQCPHPAVEIQNIH